MPCVGEEGAGLAAEDFEGKLVVVGGMRVFPELVDCACTGSTGASARIMQMTTIRYVVEHLHGEYIFKRS